MRSTWGGPWWRGSVLVALGGLLVATGVRAGENLLQNPGFEETGPSPAPGWIDRVDSQGKAKVTDKEAHGGRQSLAIPAHSAVEQQIKNAPPGAYLARGWVKSETEQRVTCILEDPERPWAVYTYADIPLPKGQWVPVEIACALDRAGSLTLTLGGMSPEFCLYHGTKQELAAPVLADDFELIRYEPKTPPRLTVWDAKQDLGDTLDWSAKDGWSAVEGQSHAFAGTPVFQGRHLVGAVRKSDGALAIYAVQDSKLQPRAVVAPTPAFKVSACSVVSSDNRTGIRVVSENGGPAYTAWMMPTGVVRVEAEKVPRFLVRECRMRYGLLPSFAGTDICYAPARFPEVKQVGIPSTQWYVGLVEGNSSMLVAVWDAASQAVSLGFAGAGEKRVIDALSIGTETGGFGLSFVEHPGLWHQEALLEDWLGEYVPMGWQRPFPARWTGYFHVTAGGEPSFQKPAMDYSFPIANTKTRMWGVWFEDWNHYPFYFDGPRTVCHFEKTFIPNGQALIYCLEPAAADLYSPCEIVEQVLGKEKAAALLDWDANRLRRLKYSTPEQFMYDRPVCATTTRLSKIKKEDKPTVGVNLATHLFEFIREIRGRVDQYTAFFAETKDYLEREQAAHPETRAYVAELEALIAVGQGKAREAYATPLPAVATKIDAMKKLLREGKGDGFDCGNLDVRGPAGTQDDLCRRFNRLVLRLAQTAVWQGGDSPEKTLIAGHILEQSRKVLREPTRWEPRRTLYFSEP